MFNSRRGQFLLLNVIVHAELTVYNNNTYNILLDVRWFRSVAVITCASHAQGPQFDPGRNHFLVYQTKVFPIIILQIQLLSSLSRAKSFFMNHPIFFCKSKIDSAQARTGDLVRVKHK